MRVISRATTWSACSICSITTVTSTSTSRRVARSVSIDGGEDLDRLVGDRGAVLEALQELTRLAVQQSSGNRSRLMLDIAGWRQARRDELTEQGLRTAKEVLASGESVRMRPMTPFERKVVHDAVARVKGVSSESEGEEPRRQVVIFRGA